VINTLWFIILASMLTMYAVLDGFDLGVGALHLWVGRNDDERGRAIGSIGPVWNGNDVWLIAAGGSMVVAFPHLYASAFSGFYLALILVVWLLIMRVVGIELRHLVVDPLWRLAWDV
jgi:cytochrome d ubiquinol oxidase subunit II